MNEVFNVEERNLICIYASRKRTKVMRDLGNSIPCIEDTDMLELIMGVMAKLNDMTDEEFAELEFVAAE